MVLDIKNFVTWIRSFLDDVYALKSDIPSGLSLDNTVTQNSSNPVKSSGIYAALSNKIDESDLLNLIYPVGSIYMSANTAHSTCPIETWLGGTWVRIQDRFLLASTTQQGVGSTGGSADAVVVKHNHTQDSHTHTQNSHYHKPTNDSYNFVASEDGMNLLMGGSKQITTGSGYHYMYATNAKGVAEYDHTGDATPTIQGKVATNQESGVDGTGKNMPPYLVVNVWKRTA